MTIRGGMPIWGARRDGPQSVLDAQIRLLLSGIPQVEDGLEGAAVYPPDWAKREQKRSTTSTGNEPFFAVTQTSTA